MQTGDVLRYSVSALVRNRFRSLMLFLSMSIGVASVVVLSGLGEGARQFVLGEFASLGKDVLVILPGRKETTGGLPPITGGVFRNITLDDAQAMRRLPGIERVAPVVVGSVRVSNDAANREAMVFGTTPAFFEIRSIPIGHGQTLPQQQHSGSVAVLGRTLQQELFRGDGYLGRWLRLGDRRYRVIGLVNQEGGSFGVDVSSAVFIPVRQAMILFNASGLFRVSVQINADADAESVIADIEKLMTERHHGELDITVISPDALLASFDDILVIMTLAVSAIGVISLLVAGILIMNVMLISISQRTHEIGLLKALGASSRQVRMLFVAEAALMGLGGAVLGMLLGVVLMGIASGVVPELPFSIPMWSLGSAMLLALAVSIIFSWFPAGRAAAMQPLDALNKR